MFHFKKMHIITTSLMLLALVLVFLSKLSIVVALCALILLSAGFGCLTYVLFDEYKIFIQMKNEAKYELLMELATTPNAEEYISRPEVFDSKDLKAFKSQKRAKFVSIVLSVLMCLSFLLLFVLKVASL